MVPLFPNGQGRPLSPDSVDPDPLPSFASLREKTMHALYGHLPYHDKSPKGSVDKRIQSLVDLINRHPSFATLSSCSGRIALFDPCGSSSGKESLDSSTEYAVDTATVGSTSSGGKGGGRWLLASHERIEPSTLVQLIPHVAVSSVDNNQHCNEPIPTVRFEPMLLHVAASCLSRGQQLLQLALQLGFRESGLVVTDTRVTVAIRSYGLALAVPIVSVLDETYIVRLVKECNQRLQLNWKRMDNLYHSIETNLFAKPVVHSTVSASGFPDLNLWGHALVALSVSACREHAKSRDALLVFGGHGAGPQTPHASTSTTPKRSDQVYRLERADNGAWNNHWEAVTLNHHCPGGAKNGLERMNGISVTCSEWLAREGSAACVLRLSCTTNSSGLVAVFGGRKGPSNALGDLLLFDAASNRFGCPCNIRGKPPEPRWGHTLTALDCSTGSNNNLAVLVGGRNEQSLLNDSVYLLSLVEDGLQWEEVLLSSDWNRFHHATIALKDNVFVFGGLTDIGVISKTPEKQNASAVGFCVSSGLALEMSGKDSLSHVFGMEATVFDHCVFGSRAMIKSYFLASGGVSSSFNGELVPKSSWSVFSLEQEDIHKWAVQRLESSSESTMPGDSYCPLVHHTAVLLPGAHDDSPALFCVGGGCGSFAFRPFFAKSCTISFDSTKDTMVSDIAKSSAANDGSVLKSNGNASLKAPSLVNVLYVLKRNARAVKKELENKSLLDLTHRMGPANESVGSDFDASLFIAIPVHPDALLLVQQKDKKEDLAWVSMVEHVGQQILPLRTAVFARHQKKR